MRTPAAFAISLKVITLLCAHDTDAAPAAAATAAATAALVVNVVRRQKEFAYKNAFMHTGVFIPLAES